MLAFPVSRLSINDGMQRKIMEAGVSWVFLMGKQIKKTSYCLGRRQDAVTYGR